MTRLALAVVLACLAVPAAAWADGDPASDVLYSNDVFIPFDVKISPALQSQLLQLSVKARSGGNPIKVAVIATQYDLGAVPVLWRRPQQYARFLGAELIFLYKGPLVIVMPNGFGFYHYKRSGDAERRLLESIPVQRGPDGLTRSAMAAVQKLSAAEGNPLALPKPKSGSATRDRLIIVAAGLLVLVVLALFRLQGVRAWTRRAVLRK